MFTLVIEASDNDVLGERTAMATVSVQLTDVNDNPPVCPTVVNLNVPESTPVLSTIGIIPCTDADLWAGAALSYALSGGSDVISVDQATGAVTLRRTLDYETMDDRYLLASVFVWNHMDSQLNASVTLQLFTVNEADFAPSLSMPKTNLFFREDGGHLDLAGDVVVADADVDFNVFQSMAVTLASAPSARRIARACPDPLLLRLTCSANTRTLLRSAILRGGLAPALADVFTLDGRSAFLQIASSATPTSVTDSLTIGAWVRQTPKTAGVVAGKTSPSGISWYYVLHSNTTSQRVTFYYTAAPTGNLTGSGSSSRVSVLFDVRSAARLDDGAWHRLTLTLAFPAIRLEIDTVSILPTVTNPGEARTPLPTGTLKHRMVDKTGILAFGARPNGSGIGLLPFAGQIAWPVVTPAGCASVDAAILAVCGEDVRVGAVVDGLAVNSSYNTATGVLGISGPFSAARAQAILRTLRYTNNQDESTLFPRTITVTATDNGGATGALNLTLNMVNVNDHAPQLAFRSAAGHSNARAVMFTEEGVPVNVGCNVVVDEDVGAAVVDAVVTLEGGLDGAVAEGLAFSTTMLVRGYAPPDFTSHLQWCS